MKTEPFCAVLETDNDWVKQALTRAGVDTRAGLRLGRIFQEAGLPAPRMILGARVERGPESAAYEQATAIVRTLLPLIERTGVASAEEIGIETLAERMCAEVVALDATVVSPAFTGAWTRTRTG